MGWEDLPLHINQIQYFSTTDPFILKSPVLANKNITYPFMINFLSGILKKLGADLILAFRIPAISLGFSSILLTFSLIDSIFKSKKLAFLGVFLILLGSGLGFLTFFSDLKNFYEDNKNISSIFKFLTSDLPHEYTHLDYRTGGKPHFKSSGENIVWIVPIVSFFGHQRSFILGFSIFSFLLSGIYHYGKEKKFWRYSILAGVLPFSHTHTFLSLFFLMFLLFFFFTKNMRSWIIFAILTFLLSFPQYIYFKKDSNFLNKCNQATFWLDDIRIFNFTFSTQVFFKKHKRWFYFLVKKFWICFFDVAIRFNFSDF